MTTDLVLNCHKFKHACSDVGLVCFDLALTLVMWNITWDETAMTLVLIYCLTCINTIVIIHAAVFQRTNAVLENTVMDTHPKPFILPVSVVAIALASG